MLRVRQFYSFNATVFFRFATLWGNFFCVCECAAAAEHKDELFPHIASFCVGCLSKHLLKVKPEWQIIFERLFSVKLTLRKLTVRDQVVYCERGNSLPACSCVNGEKMTGALAANTPKPLQDVAQSSSSFSVLINLQRQKCVTAVFSPQILLLDCMCCCDGLC